VELLITRMVQNGHEWDLCGKTQIVVYRILSLLQVDGVKIVVLHNTSTFVVYDCLCVNYNRIV
jgi:hypothetical protein